MAHPYSTPLKLTFKCVQTRTNKKAASFVSKGSTIEISNFNTFTVCALTDGSRAILHKKNGPTPEFEAGDFYILKNCTLSNKHGQDYLLLGRTSMKFRTAPLVVTEEAEKAALDALCPPSPFATGEEEDLFVRSGYLSLRGKVEKVSDVCLF